MIKNIYIILLIFGLILVSSESMAQNGINSPYSRYGFGILSDRSMGFNKGMAGVSQGFRDGQIVNVANPASYSAVDSITALFDFGFSVYNGNYKMGELQQNAKNSSFDYLAFHFRAAHHLGLAIGVLPYSNIKYSFESSSTKVDGSESTTTNTTYDGDGGLHQAFFGLGWQPLKTLSIGANVGYLFGDYSHITTASFSDADVYSNIRGYTASISTYTLDLGLQYNYRINKRNNITFGFTYGLGHDIDNRAQRYTRKVNSSLQSTSADTITLSNAFQLPVSFAGGVTYSYKNIWKVGADFELQKWSDCRFPTTLETNDNDRFKSVSGLLNDRMKISLGGMYTPNEYSRNYLNRIQYKAGAYYSRSYANADFTGLISDKPYEFGISAGVSLPIDNKNAWRLRSKVNITAQWIHTNIPYADASVYKQSGIISKQTLQENYLKLCIGLTFSETWFQKWLVQ